MRQLFFLTLFALVSCTTARGENPGGIATAGTRAGQRQCVSVSGVEYPFRWCPPGTFLMGSPTSEKDRDDCEVQHRVTFTTGFWLLETEVTQQMYRSIMGQNPSWFKGDLLPVDQVSWIDANSFCQKLSQLAGVSATFALPTEAQWEYAARAGSSGPYAGELNRLAWYGESTDSGSTHVVGTKAPNAWGIHDMHGNLWEWCRDGYSDWSSADVIDPKGPETAVGDVRIDRGGCWDSTPEYCRSAHRGVYEQSRKSRFVGFRIVAIPMGPNPVAAQYHDVNE